MSLRRSIQMKPKTKDLVISVSGTEPHLGPTQLKKRHTRGKNQNVSRLIALTRWRSSADFQRHVVLYPEQNGLSLNVRRILLTSFCRWSRSSNLGSFTF